MLNLSSYIPLFSFFSAEKKIGNMSLFFLLSGGRKKKIPFRRQRMEIDQAVPENPGFGFKIPPPDDPYVADLLQVCPTHPYVCSKSKICLYFIEVRTLFIVQILLKKS